jgi:hypothetical protein
MGPVWAVPGVGIAVWTAKLYKLAAMPASETTQIREPLLLFLHVWAEKWDAAVPLAALALNSRRAPLHRLQWRLKESEVRFLLDGNLMDPLCTVSSSGLEDGGIMEVIRQQIGD